MARVTTGSPRFGRVPLVALVTLAAACGPLAPDLWEDRQERLERSRERWQDARITAYRFTSVTSCECIPGFVGPVEIEVVDGRITALTPVQETVTVPEEHWPAFPTIEELFDRIEDAIARRAHQLDVDYDPLLGHPTQIGLDLDGQMVDDELGVRVSALTILERAP